MNQTTRATQNTNKGATSKPVGDTQGLAVSEEIDQYNLEHRSLGNQAIAHAIQSKPNTEGSDDTLETLFAQPAQRRFGNQTLAHSIQPKLTVGAPNDKYEQEADRVAEKVMRIPEPVSTPASANALAEPAIQRMCTQCSNSQLEEEDERTGQRTGREMVQRLASGRPTDDEEGLPQHGAQIDSRQLKHGGVPLPSHTRQFYESRFNRDLGDVRIHSGQVASNFNQSIHSHAFTYANHVWLGGGKSALPSYLLAHELTHVIQQTQPSTLGGNGANQSAAVVNSGTRPRGVIQRLGLSDPFWIPLGAKGKRGGSDIHAELLGFAQKNNPKLDIEAPAPNANRKERGLGLQGSIDLYQSDTMPGLYFDGRPIGEEHPDPIKTVPKKHFRAALKGPKAARFKPFVQRGVIRDIDMGPRQPKLGELKPAVKSILGEGDEQLTNYQKGLKLAADLTNDWASRKEKAKRLKPGKLGRWKLGKPGRLPSGAVDFSDSGKDMKFNPLSPRSDTTLVLGTIAESSKRGAKYVHNILFNPAKFGLPPIKGGLYAQRFTGGASGLWMYFARPKNLDDTLKLARSAIIKGEMVVANKVQDQVIDPLLKAPKKVSKLSKEKPPALMGRLRPKVQRTPKTKSPKLEDDFKYKSWIKNQRDLRHKISGPGTKEDTKKQIASMEFLHKAYRAEEKLDKIPGTGKTSLPAKGTDLVKIVSGKGKTKKTTEKELSDLGGWLKGWTGKPAEVLGYFRDKFGGTFTWVANKFINIRDRIQEKFEKHFKEKSGVKGKSGKAKMILQALGKALKQVAKILLPRTLHLVMDALETGIKKKLTKVFNIDPAKMLEDKFGKQFEKWSAKLDNYKKQARTFVDNTFKSYTKDLGWLQELIDLGKKIGPVLEAVAAGIQCATPPVWGCLKLLARKLTDCGIAKAMNICTVQKEIADLTMAIKSLRNLPSLLGQKIMDVLKGAAPEGLKDVFDEPLAAPPPFNSNEIECEFTKLPSGCPSWGLIELDGGKGAPPKKDEPSDGEDKDAGKPESDKGESEPKPGVGTPPKGKSGSTESEAEIKRRDDFLEKLTKEELDELYREARRQGLMDKPFKVEKAEELLKKAKKNLKAKKERARKRRAERKRKAEARRKKEKESRGKSGPGEDKGEGDAGPCIWDTSSLAVGGFLLEGDNNILDFGHTHSTPFNEKLIFACGGASLMFKYDFIIGSSCDREGTFTKPVVSAEISFKSASRETVFFKKTESNPWANKHYVDPKWGPGSRIDLGHINSTGELRIKISMKDPDTGVTKSISAKIPINVDCS